MTHQAKGSLYAFWVTPDEKGSSGGYVGGWARLWWRERHRPVTSRKLLTLRVLHQRQVLR